LIDIIFLAIVAAFILYKLRNELGKESGIDPRELGRKPEAATEKDMRENIITIPREEYNKALEETATLAKYEHSPVSTGLLAIKTVDPSFSIVEFMVGAKTAFEWVLEAFSKGEKQKLVQLLSDDVFQSFSREIDAVRARNQKLDTTLVSILSQDVIEAGVRGGTTATITVKIISEQIQLVRDDKNTIIEGDASTVSRVEDEWTFERDIHSRNPNWKITAT
jgi:predicted lipid-binding transport protein (Tim44 family)